MSDNPIVHIDSKIKEIYYDRYTDSKKEKLFDRYIDLFLLAAAYGYINNNCPNLKKDTTSPFRWSNFNPDDIILIKSISLATTKNPDILFNNEEMIKIVEKYAQGGIKELIEKIEQPGDKILNILYILNEVDMSDN